MQIIFSQKSYRRVMSAATVFSTDFEHVNGSWKHSSVSRERI